VILNGLHLTPTERLTLHRLEETGSHEPWRETRASSISIISLAVTETSPPPLPPLVTKMDPRAGEAGEQLRDVEDEEVLSHG
jgi:hypothetical protein